MPHARGLLQSPSARLSPHLLLPDPRYDTWAMQKFGEIPSPNTTRLVKLKTLLDLATRIWQTSNAAISATQINLGLKGIIYTYLHDTGIHYVTLPCSALHYLTTWHYIHYMIWRDITLLYKHVCMTQQNMTNMIILNHITVCTSTALTQQINTLIFKRADISASSLKRGANIQTRHKSPNEADF